MKALEIKNLSKSYLDNKVLDSINLDIEEGDFFSLLGHNWAGKTTSIWIITDLVKKDSWTIKVFWIDIDLDFDSGKRLIWVVPQEFNLNIFSKVIDIPVYQAWFYGVSRKVALERSEFYLKKLWLWEKRNAEARELSWGMKRRLMIVRALVHEPKLLILDEPTAWVDVELRKSMRDFLIELNKSWTTILLTTHYLEEAEALCNKVAILNKWKIIENTKTKDLLKKLDEQVIIIYLENPLDSLPESFLKKYPTIIKWNELEISLSKKYNFNELFSDLMSLNLVVEDFKNKTSRLEQLFLKLTK